MTAGPKDERAEAALATAFGVLAPSEEQRRRLGERTLRGMTERRRSLAGEWLDLLRARPLVNTGWLLAAAAVLFLTTPLGALPRALAAASARSAGDEWGRGATKSGRLRDLPGPALLARRVPSGSDSEPTWSTATSPPKFASSSTSGSPTSAPSSACCSSRRRANAP